MEKPEFDISKIMLPLELKPDTGQYANFLYKNAKRGRIIIDNEVILPISKKKLQRELCWTLHQKQEFILSFLKGNNIPPIAYLEVVGEHDLPTTVYIIDGKQRLNAYFSFIENKYPILCNGIEYYYDELTLKVQSLIFERLCIAFPSMYVWIWEEDFYTQRIETFMLNWFHNINFAGTPQDVEHLKYLFNS